jgi:hypothetical protein
MPGSKAGQKNAPICTSTCAAQTAATNRTGDLANVSDAMVIGKAVAQIQPAANSFASAGRKHLTQSP